MSLFLEQYGLRGLATAPGSLPAVRPITALGHGRSSSLTPAVSGWSGTWPRWRPVLATGR